MLSFYSHSSDRKNKLLELQEELQVKKLGLLKLCTTRWLSRGNAVCRICAVIPYVLIQLVREAKEDVQSAVSALETLLTHRFMAALMLIADILYHLNQLSLIFQRRDLRNIDVTEHVARVIRTLEETYINGATVSSPQWQTFRSEVPNLDKLKPNDTYTYRGSPEIPFDRIRHDEALREVKTFTTSVVEKLREYFPSNPIIAALDIFDVRSFPKTAKEWTSARSGFGRDRLGLLLKHYTDLGFLRAQDWAGILNEWELLKDDLFQVRHVLSNDGTKPLEPEEETRAMTEFYKKWLNANPASSEEPTGRAQLTSSMRFLICAFLCIELSSVCCERGFSTMNNIKCKARNRMYVETLDCLMMIALNGPKDASDHTAIHLLIEEAYEHWASVCKRNILKSHFVKRPRTVSRKVATEPELAEDAVEEDDAACTSDKAADEQDDAMREAAEQRTEAREWRHVECFGQELDLSDDINFEAVDADAVEAVQIATSAAAAAAHTAGITQEALQAAVGCYQPPKDGKHKGWAPVSPAPVFSESEVESEEGCTNLHKRKNRWIAHIFHSGWDVGRIQDDKAPRGHKYEDQYQVRYPSDGSTYFHVLHPAQYGPDRSWVYIEQPPLVRHAIRPADRRVLRSGKPSGR